MVVVMTQVGTITNTHDSALRENHKAMVMTNARFKCCIISLKLCHECA
jgi:hypothetical protein